MKKTIVIISLILGILFPMQAQDYLYKKNSEPMKISFDKLYVMELDDKYYLTDNTEIKLDAIAGEYRASGLSAFDETTVEEWTLTITRDEQSENQIWIHPIIAPFAGLQAQDVNPVYAYYDDVAGTINLPLGQTLFGGPDQNYNIVLGIYTGSDVKTGGNALGSFAATESTVEISWSDMLVAYDNGFYQALLNMSFTRVEPAVVEHGNVTPLSLVDSISKAAPTLRLLNYEKSEYGSNINLFFNYNLLSPNPYANKYAPQGWFNEMISYKAYDSENNIVKEDYIDVFGINDNNVEIMMVALLWDGESNSAYYDMDGFLPCDTALQVAFTISPEALVWAGDTTIAYEGLESYVDEQGNRHGIVIDYYNERPRLLSTSPLNYDPKDSRIAYLQFSEDVTSLIGGMQEITYCVYRKNESTHNYDVVQTGTDFYLTLSGTQAQIILPQDVTLVNGDIVTISYDNWVVCDPDFCTATPSSMHSGVNSDGNPYGMWWMVDSTINDDPQDPTAFFQEGTYNFNIVLTQQGEQYAGKVPVTFSKVNDAFDLSKLFNTPPTATAIEWSVEGLLTGCYGTAGVRDLPFPALTYEYDYNGARYQEAYIIDYASQDGLTYIGQIDWLDDGNYIDVALGFVDGQYIASYWQFVLADENGNTEAPVEDLMGMYVNETAPCFFAYGDLGQGEGWYIIMQFEELTLTKDGSVEAKGAKKFDKPVKVELAGKPMSFSGISTNFNR